MSTVINKGVKIYFKSVTANLFTVVCLLVEPSTSILKQKSSFGSFLYIRQHNITLTSISNFIPPYLPISFSIIHQIIG